MTTVLEEVTEGVITAEHVERRVDEWAKRIDDLYAKIRNWLPGGYTASRSRTVSMHEDLMVEAKIAARDLPVLDIFQEHVRTASLVPRALWIIGANGRIDFFPRVGQYIWVDRAENFYPSLWTSTPLSQRTREEPLTQALFISLLQA